MVVGEFTRDVDCAVIGAGPGGYEAAFRAAECGLDVVLIDRRPATGGLCLHAGCVPSKILTHLAAVAGRAAEAGAMGLTFGPAAIDPDATRAWIDGRVGVLVKGLEQRAKSLDVQRLTGSARFEDRRTLTVTDGETVSRVRFRHAIVAVGVEAGRHPDLPDDPRVLRPAAAVRLEGLERIPARLLVAGRDPWTIELAAAFAALGGTVTLVIEDDAFVPGADADLAEALRRALAPRWRDLRLGGRIESAETRDEGLAVRLDGTGAEEPITELVDAVIAAGPARPDLEALRLDRTWATLDDHGRIIIDAACRTADARVLAVGDATVEPDRADDAPALADRAIHQGRVAGAVAAGRNEAFDARAVPSALFTDPGLAWCGLTESAAAAEGLEVAVHHVPLGMSGRAIGMGRTRGRVKLISDPGTGMLLGAGLVAPEAAEIIGAAALAIEMSATLTDLALTVHPHPTVAELLGEAARAALAADEG